MAGRGQTWLGGAGPGETRLDMARQGKVLTRHGGQNPKGGRPSMEYNLTLDMAKELSMVERTERGREARKSAIIPSENISTPFGNIRS